MRKLFALAALAALVALFVGSPTLQAQFSEDQLAQWQAVAETFYAEGVDENFMINADYQALDNMWGYRDPRAIQSGMIAPDFTLMDIEGRPHSLSDYVGEKFIVLVTGSWY